MVKIVNKMYYQEGLVCLKRKHLKVKVALTNIGSGRGGVIGNRATFRA